MVGTIDGGKQAAETNKQLYGEDYYARIGKTGGTKGRTGGFGSDKVGSDGLTGRQRARTAGIKGGRISKRNKPKEV